MKTNNATVPQIFRYFKLYDFYHSLEAFANNELALYPEEQEKVFEAAHLLDYVRCSLVRTFYDENKNSPLGEIK